MKTITITITALCLGIFAWCIPAAADQHEEPPQFFPVELLTCDFKKNRGFKDLDRANARFNKWSDENDPTGYSAWTLVPQYYNAKIDWEVGWLGAWADGNVMGASTDGWIAAGDAVSADYEKTLDCNAHLGAQALPIRQLQAPPGPTGLIMFTSCTLAEGTQPEKAYEAHMAMSNWLASKGSKHASWIMWPTLGAGEIDFDYFLVAAYDNYTDLGATSELMGNGGGWMESRKIFGDMVSCDVGRVYYATLVRNGMQATE